MATQTTLTIQQGRYQYIGGTDKDNFLTLPLRESATLLDDQDIFRTVSALQQAQDERAQSTKYRLHGTLNTVSFLTNKPVNWTTTDDLIRHSATTTVNEDFELCVGYVAEYIPYPTLGTGYYERKIKLLKTGTDIDILPCGFAKNVFSDPQLSFIVNGEVDIAELITTGLPAPWPVTDLVLYLRPRGAFESVTPASVVDTKGFNSDTQYGFIENDLGGTQAILASSLVRYLKPVALTNVSDSAWSNFIYPEIVSLFRLGDVKMTPDNIRLNEAFLRAWTGIDRNTLLATGEQLDANGLIFGGIISFDTDTLEIREVTTPTYHIGRKMTLTATSDNQAYVKRLGYTYTTTIDNASIVLDFGFTYQPMQLISIRQFSEFVERGKAEDTANIPSNAIVATDGSGDFIWRDLLDAGYIESSSGRGIAAPFLNGGHYVFKKASYVIGPDLANHNSFNAFKATRLTLSSPSFRL